MEKTLFEIEEQPRPKSLQTQTIKNAEKDSYKNQYQKIINRNLFKVEIKRKKDAGKNQNNLKEISENLQPTTLDLTLWGTVIGSINTYAVIEDKKNKLQALYQIGDRVLDAVIKQIVRDKVILTYHHQDYILEMDIRQNHQGLPAPKDTVDNKPREIIINKSILNSYLNNIDDLKRQIRVKPVITKGRPDGLLLHSITPDSFFHTLGLKNGDIVKKINEHPVLSIKDAVNLYPDIKNISNLNLSILRHGNHKEFIYRIRPDKKAN